MDIVQKGHFLRQLEVIGSLGQHLGTGTSGVAQQPARRTPSCWSTVKIQPPCCDPFCKEVAPSPPAYQVTGQCGHSYPSPARLSEPVALIYSSGVCQSFFHSGCLPSVPNRKLITAEALPSRCSPRRGKAGREADTLQVSPRAGP